MKKIFFGSTIHIVAIMLIANIANAQRSDGVNASPQDSNVYAKKEKRAAAENNIVSHNVEYYSTEEIKSINKRAFKNFTSDFKKSEDVKWFQLKDGFVAYCTVNSIRNRSVYNKRGDWLYTVQSYGEGKLPKDIRALAKRTYYDFAITGVQEIHAADKIVYLLYMKDDTTCQTVRISDYEMELVDSFPRSL